MLSLGVRKLIAISPLLVVVVAVIGIAVLNGAPVKNITLPPVLGTATPNAIEECNPLIAFPGEVVAGSSGFVTYSCADGLSAMMFNNTITPAFTLTTGETGVAVVSHLSGTVCNFNFNVNPFTGVVSGARMTAGTTLNFTQTPTRGQLLQGGYDFCVQYANAPLTGLATFTISFT